MSLEVDGELKWKDWRASGLYVNETGRFMRLTDGDVFIWYEVTPNGFQSVSNQPTNETLEILFQERYVQ